MLLAHAKNVRVCTVTIGIPDSFEYRTVRVSGTQMGVAWLGGPFEYIYFEPLTGFLHSGFQSTI